jgi:hypothetical protein
MDRIAPLDGMVLVEISPHRDMDSHPHRRSPTTPFDVHFESLLPGLSGQRFYSQMIDGWVWNEFRGQVVGAATFRGRRIQETPVDVFVREMERWGVRHLFVWTQASREYLAASDRFVERWNGGRWTHVEMRDADVRTVVTMSGSGTLHDLDLLGASVQLVDVVAGDAVIVRANYYPAWRAYLKDTEVTLFDSDGQLAFRAPESGSYVLRLEYPRYRTLSAIAVVAFAGGIWGLMRWPRASRSSGIHWTRVHAQAV